MAYTSNTFQPVMYDFNQKRFYTQQPKLTPQDTSYYQLANLSPFSSRKRTYLDEMNNNPFGKSAQNSSQIQQMMANRQPYQYNAPTAAQMFGGVSAPQSNMFSGMGMLAMGQGMNMGGQGLFGAGRFLGGQGLLGNSTSTIGT